MIERIAGHFEGRWRRGYVRGKLRSDPAYSAVFDLLKDAPLPVLDVGCGLGLLAFYLRERGFAAAIRGVDFDADKVAQAQRIAARSYHEVAFEVGDVMAVESVRGSVVLLDVLHYLPATRHAPLLAHLAGLVAPGGVCVIRATPRDTSWRFRVTQVEEFLLRASGWMESGAADYPHAAAIVTPFRECGFICESRPLWGRTPFNSYLFVCRRPASNVGRLSS